MPSKRTIPLVCEMCGAPFLAYPHRVKRGLARFCTRVCAGAHNGHARIKTTWQERFWAKVNKDGPVPAHMPHLGQCWLWTAGRFRKPGGFEYGAFRKDGQNRPAHNVALEMQLGRPLGPNMNSLHRCDTPLCVRNDGEQGHLFEGTQGDNVRDCVAKGRYRNKWSHTIVSEAQNHVQTSMSSR